jgi:hypothetical protein
MLLAVGAYRMIAPRRQQRLGAGFHIEVVTTRASGQCFTRALLCCLARIWAHEADQPGPLICSGLFQSSLCAATLCKIRY